MEMDRDGDSRPQQHLHDSSQYLIRLDSSDDIAWFWISYEHKPIVWRIRKRSNRSLMGTRVHHTSRNLCPLLEREQMPVLWALGYCENSIPISCSVSFLGPNPLIDRTQRVSSSMTAGSSEEGGRAGIGNVKGETIEFYRFDSLYINRFYPFSSILDSLLLSSTRTRLSGLLSGSGRSGAVPASTSRLLTYLQCSKMAALPDHSPPPLTEGTRLRGENYLATLTYHIDPALLAANANVVHIDRGGSISYEMHLLRWFDFWLPNP
uniref:Uncharacterized protein n=1 Tax=Pristionchus pacificus TaxID=54126 RepID=A0A2A6B4A7_PRIPA|eukprot:PDM60716.1 hypothetical protein PRIPAC_54522 [Pristionchus pacificus]